MPWPFDGDDPFDKGNFFKTSDVEELFKMLDGLNNGHFDNRDSFMSENPRRQPVQKIKDPRSYFLHDPYNGRMKPETGASSSLDSEVNIKDDYSALLSEHTNQPSSSSSMSSESISTSWTIKDGKMCKNERREQVVGRTRRVSVTSTDENGNTSTSEYTEEI